MNTIRGEKKGFGPVFSPQARALLLGSYPSPRSFEQQFYYGHPQNRFWPLLACLTHSPVPETIEQKTALIINNNLALWDSLERCQINGASDSSITYPVPNDISRLVKGTRIEAIFCNGAASYRFYNVYCKETTGIEAVKLPSTSPANAAYSLQRLRESWQPLCQYLPQLSNI